MELEKHQMRRSITDLSISIGLLSSLVIGMAWWQGAGAQSDRSVPRAWDDKQIVGYRLPLAGLGKPPTLVDAQKYYALPESNLKTYPVYTPDKEPAGYLDWLKETASQTAGGHRPTQNGCRLDCSRP